MTDVCKSWDRIVVWYRQNVLATIWQWEGTPSDWMPPAGASAAELIQAEQAMGVSLPDELRASYLLHDGCGDAIFPWGYHLLSREEMIQEWRKLREWFEKDTWKPEPEGPIHPVYWDIRWIPVASNENGDYFFVDLDPAPGGTVGQVIHFHHEVGPVRVLATGFGEWLTEYADRLEAGFYCYDPKAGWVRRVGRNKSKRGCSM